MTEQVQMAKIKQSILAKTKNLGGFSVRRLLPSGLRQIVRPLIFFDPLGPATFAPGTGIEVRPHAHVGLATLTCLYAGEVLHRHSLGSKRVISPGAVNWMTAGRGIVHSERTKARLKSITHRTHGLKSWIALPKAAENLPPTFHHYPADRLPAWTQDDIEFKLLAGTAYNRQAPVAVYSPLFNSKSSAGRVASAIAFRLPGTLGLSYRGRRSCRQYNNRASNHGCVR